VELVRRFAPHANQHSELTKAKIRSGCRLRRMPSTHHNSFLPASEFTKYGRDTFFGDESRFKPEGWSCWDATLKGRSRTNNRTEGLNRGWKRQHLRGAPPRLSQCIKLDRKGEEKASLRYRL
jgi:hypothetical protein